MMCFDASLHKAVQHQRLAELAQDCLKRFELIYSDTSSCIPQRLQILILRCKTLPIRDSSTWV